MKYRQPDLSCTENRLKLLLLALARVIAASPVIGAMRVIGNRFFAIPHSNRSAFRIPHSNRSAFRTPHSAFLIPLLLLVAFALVGCDSHAGESAREHQIPVRIAEVVQQEIAFPVETSGQLAAKAEVKLAFKIGGIIERIYVDEGSSVRKGQLLATLVQSEIKAQADQARSAFEKAQRDLERVTRLYGDSVATLEQRQNAATALDVARAGMEIAEFNLKHSRIYAPGNGKILHRAAENSELVSPGAPVLMFGATGQEWIVRAGLADRDLVRIQLGDSATVMFDVYPGERFPAAVSEIAEALDPRSGTFEVELTLQPGSHRLVSGFVARVAIHPSRREKVSLIPVEALVEGEGANGFVFAPASTGGGVRKLPVHIVHILDDAVAVSSGLENVNTVITDGAPYLVEGSLVEVVE